MMKYRIGSAGREYAHNMLPLGEAIIAYFEQRRPTGDFLGAVLANDLVGAFSQADDRNSLAMRDYVFWLYNYAPGRSSGVWGSREAVAAWLSGKDPEGCEDREEIQL